MTKQRTITGFAAVALLAMVATVVTMRAYSQSTDRSIGLAGLASFKDLSADVNKLPNDDYDDQSLVFSRKR